MMLMSRRLAQAFVLKMCRVLKNDQVPKPYVHEKNDCQRVACFVYAPGMATKIMPNGLPGCSTRLGAEFASSSARQGPEVP